MDGAEAGNLLALLLRAAVSDPTEPLAALPIMHTKKRSTNLALR